MQVLERIISFNFLNAGDDNYEMDNRKAAIV